MCETCKIWAAQARSEVRTLYLEFTAWTGSDCDGNAAGVADESGVREARKWLKLHVYRSGSNEDVRGC